MKEKAERQAAIQSAADINEKLAEVVFKELEDEEKKYVCKECGEVFSQG